MKNLENMNDLIIAYIDGDLDSASESILFNRLAGESELRNELREHISIRTIVQEDSSRLLPSNRLRQQVMAAVGIEDAAAVHPPWYRDAIRLPLLAALTATLVTFLLMGGGDRISPASGFHPAGTSSSGSPAPSVRPGSSSITSGAVGEPDAEVEGRLLHPPTRLSRTTHAMFSADRNRPLPTQVDAPKRHEQPHAADPVVESPTVAAVVPRTTMPTATRHPAAVTVPALKGRLIAPEGFIVSGDGQPAIDESISAEHRFQAELRGGIAGSFPSVDIGSSSQYQLPDGTGGSLLYRFDAENALGIGVGIQVVGQEYEGVEGGSVVHYRQNPSLLRIGAHYRRTLNTDWFGGHLRPYVGAIAGGTTLGPSGSIETGLLFTPDERTSFLAGVDGSLFAYRFQQNWYSSRTFGFVYGVSLTF